MALTSTIKTLFTVQLFLIKGTTGENQLRLQLKTHENYSKLGDVSRPADAARNQPADQSLGGEELKLLNYLTVE